MVEFHFDSLTPTLNTEDMEATILFYTIILGFEEERRSEGSDGITYQCLLKKDDYYLQIGLHFGKNKLPASVGPLGFTLWIQVDGINELYDTCKKNGVNIYRDIIEYDTGEKYFAIKDINGYVLNFIG